MTFPRSERVKKCLTLICVYKQRVEYSKEFVFTCHAFSDLEEGKTYQFDNLLVRREYNTKDIILAKPKLGAKL